MKKEKNKENKGMNSEGIVFFDSYIRKNRFSALIFYLSKENEWKNEEFVRKNEEFVRKNEEFVRKIRRFLRKCAEYIRLQQ